MSTHDDDLRIERLERRAIRERAARQEAERLLEAKARELYAANRSLQAHKEALERTVEHRTRALTRALAEAERASAAKTSFLAHMSHELRTPLMAILGHVEDLRAEGPRVELDVVHRNAYHLLALINEVLDLSKVESGTLELVEKPTDLGPLWHDLETTFAPRAEAQGVRLATDIQLEHPAHQLDPLRLKQILINLLSNALQHTPRGEVRLVVREVHDRLLLTVADTGTGIEPEALGRIFEPFVQAEGTPRRGTGLGLSIAQRLAERMHGQLTVDSTPGVGSRFTLDLPARPVALPAPPPPLPRRRRRPLDGVAVLIADDAPDNLMILRRWCERAGARVTTVPDGREAVRAVEGHDIVLMDMQMPVMDGLAATRELRRRGDDVPILALTANTMVSDRDAALEAGCDAFLGKPIDKARLLAEIARWTVGFA